MVSPASREALADGIFLLHGFADAAVLLPLIRAVAAQAPFRHMVTPVGRPMSAALTSCGDWGWTTSREGYVYRNHDPDTGRKWPTMPAALRDLAITAMRAAGFDPVPPDSCLINRYAVGARLTPHRDDTEREPTHPIVSVSLGLPAAFEIHGAKRATSPRVVDLSSGDVMVWGGPARLMIHGVRELAPGDDPACGPYRYNLTLRRAG